MQYFNTNNVIVISQLIQQQYCYHQILQYKSSGIELQTILLCSRIAVKMKSIFILTSLAVLLFNTVYAAPTKVHKYPQLPFHRADFQTYKATKLNLLNFILDVLSTISENLKNDEKFSKGLSYPHLLMTLLGKLISGARKDTADPNDILTQTLFDWFNTILSMAAKDIDDGSVQNKITHQDFGGNIQSESGKWFIQQ